MNTGPGIIVNIPKPKHNVGSGAGSSPRHRRRSSRRSTVQLQGSGHAQAGQHPHGVDGIDVERLSYINTALEAVPGMTLRRFFAPIMRVRGRLTTRDRATKQRLAQYLETSSAAAVKARKDAVNHLCTALVSAAADVLFDAPLTIDTNALAELLANKLEPVSYRVEDVLSLPYEPAEAAFVYLVVHGSVRVTHYQQQLRRVAPAAGSGAEGSATVPARASDRKQFFTSSDEVFRLCTVNGLAVGMDGLLAGEGAGGGASGEAAGGGATVAGNTAAAHETASASNMTTAIQRSLRKASRVVGQPTLQVARTEVLRAPCVLGAAEALGLAPGRCATCTATATAMAGGAARAAGGGDGADGGLQYVEYTDVLRVRALDVHAALVELARRDREVRGEWLTAPLGALPPRGVTRTVGDFVAAARAKTLTGHFPQNEILMRQSWLLQDTPPATLRSLISRLTPRTYMPGEVVACPHMNATPGRQLCFLRRGRLLITEAPPTDGGGFAITHDTMRTSQQEDTLHSTELALSQRNGSRRPRKGDGGVVGHTCGRCEAAAPFLHVLEVVHAGTSFGELSVLFGEARGYTLVADSVCDVWCLPHADFARTMRRDDTLRATLVEKAAALRIKWLAEQRFTPALADHLRRHSELFRPFCDVTLRLIQERIEPVVYSPGQLLTSTSEKCQEVIFIMQGHVASICEGVAAYGPGDVLGEGCLVAHRWPLGLAARTMVEGWRLPRDKLLDALTRADRLHAHSGEVTSQAPILMKQIFQPPVPEVESDVVGRLRMPVVAAAPGSLSYPEYARRTAEVLLKALCYTYRDYVKWEDINYASMDGGKNQRELAASDALAREYAIATMRGEPAPGLHNLTTSTSTKGATAARAQSGNGRPSTGPPQQQQQRRYTSVVDAGAENAKSATVPSSGAAGSGRAAASRLTSESHATATTGGRSSSSSSARKLRVGGKGRRNNTGASAFLVNAAVMDAPFTRRPRASGVSEGKRGRSQQHQQQLWASSVNAMAPYQPPATTAQKLPPRLRSLTHTLGERDRILATEMREEAELEKKLAAQQRATVREHLATAVSPLSAAKETTALALPGSGTSAAAGAGATVLGAVRALASGTQGSTALVSVTDRVPAPLLVSDPVPLTEPMPPVHVFLSGERPRSEITMSEALSIGYVMQLPASHSIQACVSFVDPDVTVGPPEQRGRRHAMAVTPNDRFHKHNFLFAAAVFENISKLEEQLQDLREEERLKKSKAQKLMSMLQTSVNSARWHADRHGHETVFQDDVLMTPGGGGSGNRAAPLSPSREPSPMNSASRRRSPSGAGVSPVRQASLVANVLATPSPFRGSPGKGAEKREEAFTRLLKRDTGNAMEMLAARYQLGPASGDAAAISGGQPQLLLNASQESGVGGVNESTTTTTAPRRRPSLLDRMRDAATIGLHADGGSVQPLHPADEGLDGVQLTNAAGLSGSVMPIANYRDRNHAQQSYLNTVARQFPSSGASGGASPTSLSTSALLLGAAPPATLETHLLQRKDSVLFVEGYGALELSPEAQAAGTVVLTPATAAAAAGAGNNSARSRSLSDDRETAVGEEGRDGAARSRWQRALSRSASANYTSASISGSNFLAGPLTPQDFVMPDVEDAAAVMRRIQRDVEGLNAVAKEQARERRAAREKERQLGAKNIRAAAVAFAKPTEEEAQVLEEWQRATHILSRDRMAPVTVPDALRQEAGPDYLRRGVAEVNAAVAAETAREAATYSVAAWQDEQQALLSTATPGRPGGGGSSARGGGMAAPGLALDAAAAVTRSDDPAAATRTIAAIGTGQLGYRAQPLVAPTQSMDRSSYESYVQDREAFFEAFKRNPEALVAGALAEPALPIAGAGSDGTTWRQPQPPSSAQGPASPLPLTPHPPAAPAVRADAIVTDLDERQFVPWLS